MLNEFVNSNTSKHSLTTFIKEDVSLKDVFKIRESILPQYLSDIIDDSFSNYIVVEDGNLIYEKINFSVDDIYINELDYAQNEIPNSYILSERNIKNVKTNNQINDVISKNNGGIAVFIKAGVTMSESLTIFNCTTIEDNLTNSTIMLGKDSVANIAVYNLNLSSSKYCMSNTNIIVEENAQLNYVEMFDYDVEFRNYSSTRITALRQSYVNAKTIYTNKHISLNDFFVSVNGENANINIDSLAIGTGSELLNNNIEIEHKSPYTSSNINNIALTKEQSKILYNNSSIIKKDMIKSSAKQKTTGIILSDESLISANPFLFIDCYDVSASHGASIGKFSDDDLFYLMSRGLTKSESEALIISGVVKPFIEGLNSKFIQEKVEKYVKEKVGELSE